MLHIIVYIVVLLIACYFQAITGFGQGLIIAPVALILFSKYTALSTLLIIGLALNGYLALRVKAKFDFHLIRTLLIGCVFGLPLGLIIVKSISIADLQVVVGFMSIALVLLFVFSKVVIPKDKTYLILAGLASGIMQTAMGLAGPPVVILLNAQETPKQVMRKTLPSYFFIVGVIGAVIYLFSGLLTTRGTLIGIVSLPFVIIAGYLGNRHGHIIEDKYYRLMVVAGVLLTGALAIYQGL